MTSLVRNEQKKLLATAVNNLGGASVVTGVIAPVAGYVLGSLQIDDPLRLASFVVIWMFVGGTLLVVARGILKGLI